MRRTAAWLCRFALLPVAAAGAVFAAGPDTSGPPIQSMSALAFGPDGALFIGDGKAGAVHALALGDRAARKPTERLVIKDLEEKIAALLGAKADMIMIHDMAVDPIAADTFLAVSRGRSAWDSSWTLPNDIADADVLLRIAPDGAISAVTLNKHTWTTAALPNPVDAGRKHPWKEGISLRADTITDIAYADGLLYVAGLSNEEFASTMWKVPYPFGARAEATTLEIYHGAHGEYESNAPIRTFLPYRLKGQPFMLAAFLCTPLVTFPVSDLVGGKHLKGRTVGEFGWGNYPLDMLAYVKEGQQRLLLANSNLPLMIIDPARIESFEGEIVSKVQGYTAGVPYEIRSGTGIQQMDSFGEKFVMAIRRMPGGRLVLESMPLDRF